MSKHLLIAMALAASAIAPAGSFGPAVMTSLAAAPTNPVKGGWEAYRYHLKDGSEYPMQGQILFTEDKWSVLFIVLKDGEPQRGNGEGGNYEVEGNNITFIHRFMISTEAEAIPGLKAQARRNLQWDPAKRETREESTFKIEGDLLTLYMPSGNRLTWKRSSN